MTTLFMPVERAPILKKRSPKDSMISFKTISATTFRRNIPLKFFIDPPGLLATIVAQFYITEKDRIFWYDVDILIYVLTVYGSNAIFYKKVTR
jgi:hypothetical protein